jgi:hypothetical protein
MIAINPDNQKLSSVKRSIIDYDEVQPCWYVDVIPSKKKEKYRFKVGCKYNNQTDEFEFNISDVGDPKDKDFWTRVSGVDFAIKLIELFKIGGSKSVEDWIENNGNV